MSYSKTYTGSVYYSGTESYSHSYPASEHGGTVSGTVHYSGTVPVTVNLYVDTNPFDNSVNDCSQSVRRLNGAVIAMNSAQVASIQKSAKEVSSHVLTGFFNMIRSELSQNMVALFSKFKAVYELLVTKSETLGKQQVVMQDDYARISERYDTIFANLDEELEKRVVALDKNVFEISKRVQSEQLYSDTSKKVAQFLLGVNEDEILQQQLLVANTKARVVQAIDGLAENVVQENAYAKKLNSIVADKNCNGNEDNYIPVVFTEASSLSSETMDYTCYSNNANHGLSSVINESVKNHFVSHNAEIQMHDENEMKQIDDAFSLIAEKEFQDLRDEKSMRVYEMLRKLKEA